MTATRFPAKLLLLLLPLTLATVPARAADVPDAGRQIAELRREIARHDEAYHRRAAPEISDYDYDQLKRRLVALEREFPELAQAVPPLPEVGDDRSGLFQTARHRERMLSLEKAHTEAELRAFHARVVKQLGVAAPAFVVEPKFDGLAVNITYEQGKFVRAVTRGNGLEGDDVSAHVRRVASVPQELRGAGWPAVLEVRGELYVPLAEFERVNAEREAAGETTFATPRNLAAGALRQLDPQEVARRGVQAVFYAVGACEPVSALPAAQHELGARFAAWGLPAIAPAYAWRATGADDLVRAVEACRQARTRFGFPVDGAVVKLDSLAQQRALGAGEHAPRWAVAFKFAPERAETQVRAITVQVGRTGALTPVAELAPVRLGGSTIARATLHNRDEIARRDIRIGDTVYVEKAGEIIPAVTGVNLARRSPVAQPFAFPTTCPECAAPVAEDEGKAVLRCPNRTCPAQLRRRVEHFASKACVDIAGLGPATIEMLVRNGRIKELPDIYRLRASDLNLADKSAENLRTAIEASRGAELWRFIHGLGIPNVGASAARDLARRFGSLAALAEKAKTLDSDAAVARAARAFFAEPENRALVAGLLAAGVQPTSPVTPPTSVKLVGRNFVLTGTLSTLTRAQATEKIHAAGGKVTASVTRETHFLIAGADPGGKLEQARKLGVLVLDEAELLRLLEEK